MTDDSAQQFAAMTKTCEEEDKSSSIYQSRVMSESIVHHTHSLPPTSLCQRKDFMAEDKEGRPGCKVACTANLWTATWLLFSTTTTTLARCRNSTSKQLFGSKSEEGEGRTARGSCGLNLLLLLSLAFAAACAFNQVVPAVHCASALGLAAVSGSSVGGNLGSNLHQSNSLFHGRAGGHLGRPPPLSQQVVDIEEEAAALIKQYHEKLEEDSPACADEHSICGYVQINSVGFNRVSLCSCQAKKAAGKGSAGHCPLWWERSTVRTVRHGNDFYKYCTRKPKLSPCTAGQVAYSSVTEYDKLTFERMSVVHRAHCLCPTDHILATNGSKPFERDLEGSLLFGTEMLCQKIPRCSRKQFCLSISEGIDATLEQRHCRCPAGMMCPKDTRQAAEVHQMLKGAAYHMRCL